MKKPINVDKISGRKVVLTGTLRSYVLQITCGLDDPNDATYLFLNPVELYDDTRVALLPGGLSPGGISDGPFLKSNLVKTVNEDGGYEFSIHGAGIQGMIDWEQTNVLVIHVDWTEQLLKASLVAVGAGVKGTQLPEQFRFKTDSVKSLNDFGDNVLMPFLNYFESMVHKLVDVEGAKSVVVGSLKRVPSTIV